MILESLIKDESRITFDCAKATIARGSRIDIADAFFAEPEIQNAIRLGFCKVIGEVPASATAAITPAEPTVWFKNNYGSRLSLDCIKKVVMPGEMVAIPQSKMNEVEIANAIAWRMLVDPQAKETVVQAPSKPVHLEELTSKDIINTTSKPESPKTAAPRREPRTVRSVNALIEDTDDEDSMFKPSAIPDSIIDPEKYASTKKKRQSRQATPEANIETATAKPAKIETKAEEKKATDDTFDFLDIFGTEETKIQADKNKKQQSLEEDSF